MTLTDHPLVADLERVLAGTEAVWRELDGARLLITGGTGFFGTWLLESLVWCRRRSGRGPRATVLSRNPSAFAARMPWLSDTDGLDWITGDIRSTPIPIVGIDAVIHAATDSDAKRNAADPLGMLDTIVVGTRHALEASVAGQVRRFLLVSSGAVYGRQPPDLARVGEDFRGAPDLAVPTPAALYGEGKRLAEMLAGHFHERRGLATVIARCFAFLGPHLPLDAHFAAGNFLLDAHLGRDIVIHGDGRPLRSYMHPADLAIWLWTLLLRGTPGRAYNVGSEDALSIEALACRIASRAPSHPAVRVLVAPGSGPAERYVPDTTRARVELGLELTVPLDAAIDGTLQWLERTQP